MSEGPISAAARRILDVTASAAGLVLLSPLLVGIAVLIRRDSVGPVIFRQTRVGRNGRPFTMFKFRTMRTDRVGPSLTAGGDDRITPIGRRLRSSKLDELPQLANVLRGDMSLVGPRPESLDLYDLWPPALRESLTNLRPGLTDPVTLTLVDEERLLSEAQDPLEVYRARLIPLKAAGYADYAQARSVGGDLIILSTTLWTLGARSLGRKRRQCA